jgi:hypothetical protein
MTLGVLAATAASSASNDVEPGILGFLVVAAMGIALVFLLRSMNKQFRKIGPAPEVPDPGVMPALPVRRFSLPGGAFAASAPVPASPRIAVKPP